MKKLGIIIFMLLFRVFASGEVFVKIYEPIRFENYNLRSISGNKLIGKGTLEIYTDNEMEDFGKKIVFKFADTGVMTNRKRVIEVERYKLEGRNNEMLITKQRELVDFYAIIDKSQFKTSKDAELLEGEYVGRVPVILSLYRKDIKRGNR